MGAIAGTVIVLAYILGAIAAPLLAPGNPRAVTPDVLASPSAAHLFGTDENGMDVLSRVIYAARIDLGVAGGAAILSVVLGVTLGLICGYTGGWPDLVLVRVLDVVQAFPVLILGIAFVGATNGSLIVTAIVVGSLDSPVYARLVRAEVLRVRETTFVMAARALGNTPARLVRKHLLPNVVPPMMGQVPTRFATAVAVVAGLAFVGVGVQAPTPEWGEMIRLGTDDIQSGVWWPSVFPGIAIVVICLGLNLMADGLQRYWSVGTGS